MTESKQGAAAVEEDFFDLDAYVRITRDDLGLKTDADRARAIKMDAAVFSRLRRGKAKPGEKFIRRSVAIGVPYSAMFPKRRDA